MKQCVRFADDLCEYHDGAILDNPEAIPRDIWFQQTEMQNMKKGALNLSKVGQRQRLGASLNNTYGRTDEVAKSNVRDWVFKCADRRGLERFHNRDYMTRRHDMRRRTILSVITAQQKMKNEGLGRDVEYIALVVCRLSEAFSKDSRQIALMLGLADQSLAENVELEETSVSSSTSMAEVVNAPLPKGTLERTYSPDSVMMEAVWSQHHHNHQHL